MFTVTVYVYMIFCCTYIYGHISPEYAYLTVDLLLIEVGDLFCEEDWPSLGICP